MDWYKEFREMSDEELGNWVSSNAQIGSHASNLAIAELTRRSIDKNKKAIKDLKVAIDKFSESSNKYSRTIVFLTCILIVLTFVLVTPLIIDFVR